MPMMLEIILRRKVSNFVYNAMLSYWDTSLRETEEGILVDRGTLKDYVAVLDEQDAETAEEVWAYADLKSIHDTMVQLDILLVLFVN